MCTIFFKQTIVNLEGVEKLAQYVGQGSVTRGSQPVTSYWLHSFGTVIA